MYRFIDMKQRYREAGKKAEKVLKEMMAKKFTNLTKDVKYRFKKLSDTQTG